MVLAVEKFKMQLMLWFVLTAAVSLTAGEPAYRVKESPDVSLTVKVSERAKKAVSPYLFAKFSEHLGSNIYGGLWAEVLDNPGMDSFERIVQSPELTRKQLEDGKKKTVIDVIDQHLPYRWFPLGDPVAVYSFDMKRPLSKPDASVCTLKQRPSELTGIEQHVILPVQRCDQYELIVHLRSSDAEPSVTVKVIDDKTMNPVLEESISGLGDDWKEFRFTFRTEKQRKDPSAGFRLQIGSSRKGSFAVDSVSLMPADNLKGWDPEAIRLIKESQCTMMRFPGGNFVSGYRWKQGLGNPFERPTVPNPAWEGQFEPNRVGSAEWMDFMALTGCEPLLCINAGDGTPEEARQWLEYFNGDSSTPMGRLRADQGTEKPWEIRFVEIGNELYGGWQVGHCGPVQYARRYEEFYSVLHREFPDVTYIANGGPKYNPEWNTRLLQKNRSTVEGISVHYLFDMKLPQLVDPENFYWLAMGETYALEQGLKERQKLFSTYSSDCFLAVTELMLYPQNHEDFYPHSKTSAEALWYSGFINSCMRCDDFVKIVTYSASMNHGASLQKMNEQIFPTPGWLAYTLYSTAAGRYPCGYELTTPFHEVAHAFSNPPDFRGFNPPRKTPLLDAFCLSSDDGETLNVFIANRSLTEEFSVPVRLEGGSFRSVTVSRLTGGETMMDKNTARQPRRIRLSEEKDTLNGSNDTVQVKLSKLELVRLTFRR